MIAAKVRFLKAQLACSDGFETHRYEMVEAILPTTRGKALPLQQCG
ncbi:hypothetical protein KXQ82_04970 [Mucilaginibacter sp. HMF5004]|nr:hypothetical protein [Mucilaginibacter rivuli]MBW4889052.1 hypothetical protein [Mucilaginibacter rivuli]